MAIVQHHFGTTVDAVQFVEVDDGAAPSGSPASAPQRPAPGTQILVKNAATLADLPPITLGTYGHWTYSWATDGPFASIIVSGNGGQTWQGPLYSAETVAAAMAPDLNIGGTGGSSGVSGIQGVAGVKTGLVTLTAADVGARPVSEPISATAVSGLADVARTGDYTDLDSTPVPGTDYPPLDPTTHKVPAVYLPSGQGSFQNPILINADGTYPPRSNYSTDRTTRVWVQGPIDKLPTLGTTPASYVDGVDAMIATAPST